MADFFIRRPIVAIVVVDRHHPARPGGAAAAVHRAVSRAVAAYHPGRNHLPGRVRGGGRAVGGHADRAAGQRRGQHDLHEVAQHERRPHAARRVVPGGHGPRHGERAGPEPRVPGPVATAAGGDPAGGHGQEDQPQHPDGGLALLAQGEPRRAVPQQLRDDQRPGRAAPRARASRRWISIGGAEYGMRVWLRPDRLARARPHARRRHLGHQGAEPPGARRAGRRGARRRRARSSPTRSRHPAGWSPPRSSRTSLSARPAGGASSGSRTSAGSSWGARTTTRSAARS